MNQLLKSITPAKHCIDGEFVESKDRSTFSNINPATDEEICRVSLGGAVEIDRAVQSCNTALRTSGWSSWPVKQRCDVLRRLADLIDENRQALAEMESIDTGKPISETFDSDVVRAAKNFRFFAGLAQDQVSDRWRSDDGSIHVSERTPLGIVGLITPWNLPLHLETWKLAPALAQGNAAILKPAELTPLTATALAHLALQAGVPKGIFNVVHGLGANSAGQALVEHPEVRAISFTGETTTGSAIMRSAAAGLKKLSFELGGKGANVIFADADLDQAGPTACRAAFRNQGQICLAGSRLIVHESIFDDVVRRLKIQIGQIVIGNPLDPKTTMGSLISRDHREKVESYITWAKSQNLKFLCGGGRPSYLNEKGAFLEPTVVLEPAQDSRLIQEEMFGPFLTVQRFSTTDEALAMLNGTPYGLSCSIWTRNRTTVEECRGKVRTGLFWINAWFLRDLNAAFGGMKRSGIGREGGRFSLDFYSEYQTTSYPKEISSWAE